MSNSEFQIGVKHGEIIGEVIIGLFFISGGGSIYVGGLKAYKAVDLVAKTYKRVNSSRLQIFEDSIDALSEAF